MKSFHILLLLFLSFKVSAQWMDVGGGVTHSQSPNDAVRCVYVHDDELWTYGGFDIAGTDTGVVLIATWDGSQWKGVFPGNDNWGNINCFSDYNDGKLYIGGHFSPTINFTTGEFVGRWNGSAWESFSYGVSQGVHINAMCTYRNKLYIGGQQLMQVCDSVSTCININDIAAWNGSHWENAGGGPGGYVIESMIVYNDELIAGGQISNLPKYYLIARWNDTTWRPVGRFGLWGYPGAVTSMVVDSLRNILYVAGTIYHADGKKGRIVVQFDGRRWEFIGDSSIMPNVAKLHMYHNELYLGNIYPSVLANGDTVSGLIKWNGKEWTGVGARFYTWDFNQHSAMSNFVNYRDTMYVAGKIDYMNVFSFNGDTIPADTIGVNNIVRYYAPPDTSCESLLSNYNRIWAQDTTYFCDSVRVAFDNNTLYYADSWLWDFGDGDTAVLADPVHIYDSAGQYNVSLITTYNSCIDTAYKTIVALPCDSFLVYFAELPDTLLMVYQGGGWVAEICIPVLSNSTNVNFTYYWDAGIPWYQDSGYYATPYGGLLNPYCVRYLQPGTYIISLVVKQDCCTDTIYDTIVVVNPTSGIEELITQQAYLGQNIPNPFSNTTLIPYYVPQGSAGEIIITDMNGRLIGRHQLSAGSNQLELSMRQFSDGIYFYSLKIDGRIVETKKMVLKK